MNKLQSPSAGGLSAFSFCLIVNCLAFQLQVLPTMALTRIIARYWLSWFPLFTDQLFLPPVMAAFLIGHLGQDNSFDSR